MTFLESVFTFVNCYSSLFCELVELFDILFLEFLEFCW